MCKVILKNNCGTNVATLTLGLYPLARDQGKGGCKVAGQEESHVKRMQRV
jgi:hypothetical protein